MGHNRRVGTTSRISRFYHIDAHVTTTIGLARPTVDPMMVEQWEEFAGQYSMPELND